MIAGLVGGVGLLLLGMRLMTDGLRVAAGEALRSILGTWTRTPLRGIVSGAMITSLVQSSGAVTVATIGFVNAGVLTLSQAVGVVYGTNIGTTMTGWLVALVGFEFDIKAVALPAVGAGMLLRLTGQGGRRGALGEALAGFGIFFLGLDILRSATAGLGEDLSFPHAGAESMRDLVPFVAAGFVLTFLMQSSSAALAIGLTSAAGGVMPLIAGAALVVGTNLGSTTTSLLAVVGATSNARRVAAAHVLFNLLTASVALATLPYLLAAVVAVRGWLGAGDGIVSTLALFHTAFNVLGVVILWPLTPAFVHFLEGRFRSGEEDARRPKHLDRTVVRTPALALDALALELDRVRRIARRMARACLGDDPIAATAIRADGEAVRDLAVAIGEFASEVRQGDLPPDLAEILPRALRGSQYFVEVADLAPEIVAMAAQPIEAAELAAVVRGFRQQALAIVEGAEPAGKHFRAEDVAVAVQRLVDAYDGVKDRLLRGGAEGGLPIEQMVAELEMLSRARRLLEHFLKGVRCTGELLAVAAEQRKVVEEDDTGGAAA